MNDWRHNVMAGRPAGPFARAARAAGTVVSGPYAGLMRLRRWAYRRGLRRSRQAGVPVICLGNITAGGTGKTPMVAWVVRTLQERGRSPAILTRGYKAVEGRSDEAELLTELTGAPVVVDPDRVAAAKRAVEAGADVCVMDDGFQHLRLRRDLDIVLIDSTNPFAGGRCPPCGLLREGLSALRAADAIVVTRCDVVRPERLGPLEDVLRRASPAASLHRAAHRPVAVVDGDGEWLAPEAIAGRKVFVFCGIANPRAFLATVQCLGAEPVGFAPLPDHVRYTEKLVANTCDLADKQGAEVLLTTEKDYVKLVELPSPRPIWRLPVRMHITAGRDELIRKLEEAVSR